MSRSRVRPRGHSGHVGAFQDEKSSRCGTASPRRDINDDGNRRCSDFLDDVARGFEKPAGRVQFDQQCPIFIPLGFGEGAAYVLIGDGMNRVVHHDFQDFRPSRGEKYA